MLRLLQIGLCIVILAFLYAQRVPLRAALGSTRQSVQSVTNDFTGKTSVDLGQQAKRRVLQSALSGAIASYRGLRGEEPRSLEDLVTEGFLQRSDAVDEWGRPLEVQSSEHGVVIRGLGADGQRGTADDWLLVR